MALSSCREPLGSDIELHVPYHCKYKVKRSGHRSRHLCTRNLPLVYIANISFWKYIVTPNGIIRGQCIYSHIIILIGFVSERKVIQRIYIHVYVN